MASAAGEKTRARILDTAQALILDRGYAATSVDMIIESMRVTKGTFFYHFRKKDDLARALIDRFAASDRQMLDDLRTRTEKLSDDPVQQPLIFVGLFIEFVEGLEEPHPGCLYASYCYESGLFDSGIHAVVSKAILEWRSVFGIKLRAAFEKRPPRMPVDADSLADMFTNVIEGAFVLARVLKTPELFVEQLRHYRNYLQLLLGESPDAGVAGKKAARRPGRAGRRSS